LLKISIKKLDIKIKACYSKCEIIIIHKQN